LNDPHEASAAPTQDRRFGFVAIIGAPNAGKSTLVNALVGAKVTIVSRKVQTTRTTIRGIAIEGASQLVLVDTPGIFQPRRRLDRAMVTAAWNGADAADAVVLMVDAARHVDDDTKGILEKLKDTSVPKVLVLNKVDSVVDKATLLDRATEINAIFNAERVFMIAALKGSGVADLKAYLAKIVPEGPWHYDADEVSDLPARMLASEITREKIYERLHDELPYEITVETTSWQPFRNGSVRIEQTIFVERHSQKAIVLGKAGATVKQISTAARHDMTKLMEQTIHLFLFVKVREGWGNDPERYREQGLEFPED
jgi:GTP-binding protein Era